MAEMAVSFARDHLLPLLIEEANLLNSVPKEFADIKKELESIQAFLKDADTRAVSEGGNNDEGVKIWVKQVREAAFHIEDIIDDYVIHMGEEQQPRDPGCVALIGMIAHLINTLINRHQIASEIQDVKSSLRGIKERSKSYGFKIQPCFEQGSITSQNTQWNDLRMAALYLDEAEVVGFEGPRERLIGWLVKGREERTVISVVGMGGQGKTTLAKKAFDSKEVVGHFDCRVWINVSQSYTVEGLLTDMLREFYKQKGGDPPKDIFQLDRRSLIDEVRSHLQQQKRYVVVFDDVWNKSFWDEIHFAVVDARNGSRIIITTRDIDVALSCKKSSFVEVHELQPLTRDQSLELFYRKAFFDLNGCCPRNLETISWEIVAKCDGLPLAIVAIGGLLSGKDRDPRNWQSFSENLGSELSKHSQGTNKILGMSYDDLPYHLKSCFLYFGIYPEDYVVKSKRLIRQWIAEGFVKEERGKILEEVAQGYLIEMIRRSLVQVSSTTFDGQVKSCRVHDMLRMVILEKFKDLSFCDLVGSEDGPSSFSGMTRRLSITTSSNSKDLMANPHVRSLLFFTNKRLFGGFVRIISTIYKRLKVLDFEGARLFGIPIDLRSLIHLKYLSFKDTYLKTLPKSIGMLKNLETLDVRGTHITRMPNEISNLRKLRHLLGRGMRLENGIVVNITSLQTLTSVTLCPPGAVEIIRELGELKQLRELCLAIAYIEYGKDLSSSINEMKHLEKLIIRMSYIGVVSDLHLTSPPRKLRDLALGGKMEKLPEWIPELQNLVRLELKNSKLTDDPMKSLQNMQSLLTLSLVGACKAETLHFQHGGFEKLKELYLDDMEELRYIIIDKGALCSLKVFQLKNMSNLKTVPTGMQHLNKLEVLDFWGLPKEIEESIAFHWRKRPQDHPTCALSNNVGTHSSWS